MNVIALPIAQWFLAHPRFICERLWRWAFNFVQRHDLTKRPFIILSDRQQIGCFDNLSVIRPCHTFDNEATAIKEAEQWFINRGCTTKPRIMDWRRRP